jgi:spore coat protein A
LSFACQELNAAECSQAGGSFQGAGTQCRDTNICGLEPYVDALPIPGAVQSVGTNAKGYPQYEITMSEERQQLHRDLPATDVWTYNGSFPGPTLETVVDQPIEVKYINDLPPRGHYLPVDTCPHGPNYWRSSALTVVHLHGGHVPARVDGQPELTFFPGEFDVYEYPNNQEPATLWYHDHALGITRLNVYMGLAAYYMLRPDCNTTSDPECELPSGQYEIPAVIQDREFNDDGTLFYPPEIQDAFFGDNVLVNGKVWPYLMVDQGKYRFRFLNGSQARVYKLRLENPADTEQVIPFTLVGTDVGLTGAPIPLNDFMMTPAERFDVIIDFSQFNEGDEIVLRNDNGQSPVLPNIMKFIVTANPGFLVTIPTVLKPVQPLSTNQPTRRFRLERVTDEPCAGGEWLVRNLDAQGNLTGEDHWDQIAAFPTLGKTEIWEFENASSIMHPMHIHLVKFQILDRNGSASNLMPWEVNTWKDTVRVPPNGTVRVIMDFDDYPGRFPFHCHILDHEDHEMMRQFQTTYDPANVVIDNICGEGEDCISNPGECAIVSGALCGNGLCEIGDGEDFTTCPADCNGSDKGNDLFNCGSDDPNDPGYNCGFDADGFTVLFDGCITDGYFCRVAQKLRACCGDKLCEGQETETNCAIDCAPAQPPVCTRNAPTFTMGADQSIAVDGSAVYTLDITNNDTAACADSTFDLSILSETGNMGSFTLPSVLSAPQVTLPAGASDTSVTLTVTGNGTGVDGDFLDSTVEVRDDVDHADLEQTDTVRTTIQAVVCSDITKKNQCNNTPGCMWDQQTRTCVDAPTECMYNDPSVTINPTAQDITTDGGSALYTVSVTNNDTGACDATTFNLFVTDSDTGVNFVVPSTLSLNSVTLDPSASQNLDLTVTGQTGAPNEAVNHTSVTATDPASNHDNVISNSVLTTINVVGVVCENIRDRTECRSHDQCRWKKENCITR